MSATAHVLALQDAQPRLIAPRHPPARTEVRARLRSHVARSPRKGTIVIENSPIRLSQQRKAGRGRVGRYLMRLPRESYGCRIRPAIPPAEVAWPRSAYGFGPACGAPYYRLHSLGIDPVVVLVHPISGTDGLDREIPGSHASANSLCRCPQQSQRKPIWQVGQHGRLLAICALAADESRLNQIVAAIRDCIGCPFPRR